MLSVSAFNSSGVGKMAFERAFAVVRSVFDVRAVPTRNVRCFFYLLKIFVISIGISTSAIAQNLHVPSSGLPRSELVPGFLGGKEYMLLNRVKEIQTWSYGDHSGHPAPAELDGLGYPLAGTTSAMKGVTTSVGIPPQFEYPTDYVETWVGGGQVSLNDQQGTSTVVQCIGVTGSASCDNRPCTAAQGYISDRTLTITSASSCKFAQGQPISAARATFTATASGVKLVVSHLGLAGTIAVPSYIFGPGIPNGTTIINQQSGTPNGAGAYTTSQSTYANGDSIVSSQTYVTPFGTPTIITNTDGNTGTGTYKLNFANPTIGSSRSPVLIYPGGRMEVAVTNETPSNGGTYIFTTWHPGVFAVTTGNAVEYMGVYAKQEEDSYWTGEQLSEEFKNSCPAIRPCRAARSRR